MGNIFQKLLPGVVAGSPLWVEMWRSHSSLSVGPAVMTHLLSRVETLLLKHLNSSYVCIIFMFLISKMNNNKMVNLKLPMATVEQAKQMGNSFHAQRCQC